MAISQKNVKADIHFNARERTEKLEIILISSD